MGRHRMGKVIKVRIGSIWLLACRGNSRRVRVRKICFRLEGGFKDLVTRYMILRVGIVMVIISGGEWLTVYPYNLAKVGLTPVRIFLNLPNHRLLYV